MDTNPIDQENQSLISILESLDLSSSEVPITFYNNNGLTIR